jgi:formylglycine-generating enzyme required for sulfatase activity
MAVASYVDASSRRAVAGGGAEGAAREAAPMANGAESGRLSGFLADAWYLPDDSLLGFVEVPGGSFIMGSDPASDPLAYDNEFWGDDRARRTLEIAAFFIGRYEVTVEQFRAFVGATGYPARPEALAGAPGTPVVNISWPDAMAHGAWLTEVMAKSPATPPAIARLIASGWRVTLPTEEQWEKAARGTDGRIYPWGNRPRADRANFGARSLAPVGSIRCEECAYGLSDMSGNVWELTRTPFRPGPYVAGEGAVDLWSDALWIMRGGCFADGERNVRAAVRGGADPGARRPFIGYRLVLSRE